MIDFLNRFLKSLSDEELSYLITQAANEGGRRVKDKLHQQSLDQEEISLINQNKRIDAIKHYRSRTGRGLRESILAIDGWMEKFSPIYGSYQGRT